MGKVKRVFKLRSSREARRPVIDFAASNVNWQPIWDIESRKRDPFEGEVVNFVSKSRRAPDWDCYSGCQLPLLSRRAVDALGRSLFSSFTFLDATINGATYYLLRPDLRIDCLDRARSKLVMFRHDTRRVMDIKRYAFHFQKLTDPAIFFIPEDECLFATQSVEESVRRHGLRGFDFVLLEGQPSDVDPNARPVIKTYENHYFGVRIEIPEPWDLVSWKHAKIVPSWRKHFQMRDDELPAKEDVGKFLFTATRHTPQGKGTIDGSIELCVFRFAPGTTFERKLSDGRLLDRVGVWSVGGVNLDYYDRDLHRPDGGTIRHAYYSVSDYIWLYAKVAGYEDAFFREAIKIFEGLSWQRAQAP